MLDFSHFSAKQIVGYIDQNFQLFASERDDAFPANLIEHVASPLWSTIRHREGFAIVYRGINQLLSGDGSNAKLMFIHVQSEFAGGGIGTRIIEEAKAIVPSGRSMDVTCEGERRMTFFDRCGFKLRAHDIEKELFHMQWANGAAK